MIAAETALAVLDAGFAVIPPKEDGSKRPDGPWRQYVDHAPDRATVAGWYATGRAGIGTICGAASGHLEMLELEGRAVNEGMLDALYDRANEQDIGELLYRVTDAYMERSPSGGVHILYRVTGGATANTKLARRIDSDGDTEVLIETRGQGGFTILAPTGGHVHPTGAAWTVLCGSLDQIVTITAAERDQLHALCATFDALPAREPEPELPVAERPWTAATGDSWFDSVVDDYNARTTWADVLTGWTHHHRHGDIDYWTRPGKNAAHGHSATTNATGTDRLIGFSSSLPAGIEPWDGTGKASSYDRFSITAICDHHGDRTATANALNERGYGRPRGTHTDVRDLISPELLNGHPAPAPRSNLPADFWTARPLLAHIRQAALSRARSADAVLGFILARTAACTPPSVRIPAIVGSEASCNLNVAIVALSGGGKSTAKQLAAELFPITDNRIVDDLPLGSGEGLIEAYFEFVEEEVGGKTKKVKRQTKTGLFTYLDEGQALGAVSSRQGSTLLPTLRSGWSGYTLGQANASEERKRVLPGHSYALAVVVGFQPEHAVKLLEDAPGGTPQRFLWLSASDPTVTVNRPAWPGRIDWEPPPIRAYADTVFNQVLSVPAGVEREVLERDVAGTQGKLRPAELDSHRDLNRLKVAALLALLDNRDAINDEDWQLAGAILDTSDAVRSSVATRAREAAAAREVAEDARAVRKQHRLAESEEQRAQHRIVRTIATHAHAKSCLKDRPGEHTIACLRRSIASRDRNVMTIEQAVLLAQSEGWIEVDGDTITPGKARPA